MTEDIETTDVIPTGPTASLDLCDRGRSDEVPRSSTAHVEESGYRDLLSSADWASLPTRVRRRFSHRIMGDGQILYRGRIVVSEMSWAGYVLAQAARLVGAPLPLTAGEGGAATVVITRDSERGGDLWTRLYSRPGRVPQVISSMKFFGGPTGLEEHLGHGLVMRLKLTAEKGALYFRSVGYDVTLFGRRVALPAWATPGACEVAHIDEGEGWFCFKLVLDHPLLGRLLHQIVRFHDMK